MHCEQCNENKELTGILPECEDERYNYKCPIPKISKKMERLLEVRYLMSNLNEIGGSQLIANAFKLSIEDLRLLAVINAFIMEINQEKKEQ